MHHESDNNWGSAVTVSPVIDIKDHNFVLPTYCYLFPFLWGHKQYDRIFCIKSHIMVC